MSSLLGVHCLVVDLMKQGLYFMEGQPSQKRSLREGRLPESGCLQCFPYLAYDWA